MSIADEISRLLQAKADIKIAIEGKGVTVSGTATLDEYPDYIDDIPQGGGGNLQQKSVTPSETAQQVTADTGYDGLSEVDVAAIPSDYVGSGVTRRSSTDLTASGATVTVPAGYYASQGSKAVSSGTAGTPTATKGTVSNHSVSVTPSVTNTAGYIASGTKTGTAVSVSASELVSGNKAITSNGTNIDVANYATVSVDVQGGGGILQSKSVTITQNGTTNVTPDTGYDGLSDVAITTNVSGGGSEPAPKKDVNFIDYDGTILYSYTASEFQALSALPANPSHSWLIAQGWNWTLAQIKAQLTAIPNEDVWVGQMYITESGKTEIDVHFPDAARLSPILTIAVNGTVTIDWGDNTTPDTVTGTSLTTIEDVPHSYASTGDYTIKITAVSGNFTFYGSTSSSILKKNTSPNENRVYSNCVQSVRLGNNVTSIGDWGFYNCCSLASVTIPSGVTSIGDSAFSTCYSLASITVPSGVTSIGDSAFSGCYSLASITIPSGVTSIGTYAFNTCYSLASITVPSGVTSIGDRGFYFCYSLASITIPSGVTSIGTYVFSGCYSLASITIPSGVTSIGDSAFRNCYGMAAYHLLPTTPPTLGGTSVFTSIPSDCVIYVPTASLSAYQSASRWSTHASRMVGE